MPQAYIGVAGVAAILVIGVIFSTNRRSIRLRVVGAAFALQIAMAFLALSLPAGRAVLGAMSGGVQAIIDYSGAGIAMVFGPLADTDKVGFSFALNVLPIIIFFSALMSVLYHVGVMQRVVAWAGGALRFVVGTGRVESLVAAANVFLGQTEAPLVVKPYIRGLTQPQLFTVMTTGMASVSGSVLAAYAQMGISIEYLLAACFMSAPGGLLMAKLIMPDDRAAAADKDVVVADETEERHSNVIMAAAVGAQDGLKLAVSIAGMLIAFVSLIALVNGLLGMAGAAAGVEDLTMQKILGFVFSPLMFLLNIPWSEAQAAGGIFGEKLVLNEFVAFASLGQMTDTLSPRTVAVLTFALCGFANISSIAIQLGALGTLAPERMPQIAKYGFHVVLAGSLSNLMSAALAGLVVQP
ncbi:MAG: NupC/NupG family nucleoside CNT transporter [Hyphomonadaceae bacterium]|nr:MAG: nucleoside transporter [Caulobacteraceae bacterium]MBT9445553.1 NupC/NupG family nucleoside CNT transporter [Hyphomonadaceae bacterium]TPW04817.1 MAG: nucleoside transporter [Alphaproteobacteria bacterium]